MLAMQAEFTRIVGSHHLDPEEEDAVWDWLEETVSMRTHEASQSNAQAEDIFDERIEP